MMTAPEIRAIRAYTHETQEKFAKRFGVNRYAVAFWESYGIADNPQYEKMLRALREKQHERVDGGTDSRPETPGG